MKKCDPATGPELQYMQRRLRGRTDNMTVKSAYEYIKGYYKSEGVYPYLARPLTNASAYDKKREKKGYSPLIYTNYNDGKVER